MSLRLDFLRPLTSGQEGVFARVFGDSVQQVTRPSGEQERTRGQPGAGDSTCSSD